MLGCSSQGNYIFRDALSAQEQVEGTFKVSKAGLYSVSMENAITAGSVNNRDEARRYLSDTGGSQPLVAEVLVQKVGGSENVSVIDEVVTAPKFSSWTSENLYMELARTRLAEGEYRIHVSFSGKSLKHPSFSSNVVVEHTYIGK